jgi:signal transduction histidine kinase
VARLGRATTHDLHGPLVNVQGLAEELQCSSQELQDWLRSYPDLPVGFVAECTDILSERFLPVLDYICEGAAKMSLQVKYLQSLAHNDRLVLDLEAVDLSALFKDIVKSQRIELQRARASVELARMATVESDGMVMRHIFQNLLENAVKYRREQRPLKIEVSMDRDPQGLRPAPMPPSPSLSARAEPAFASGPLLPDSKIRFDCRAPAPDNTFHAEFLRYIDRTAWPCRITSGSPKPWTSSLRTRASSRSWKTLPRMSI